MRHLSLLYCLVLLGFSSAAFGQNGSGIYLGKGQMLRAGKPRQLTLNAQVSDFAYQPGGDSIAYVGVEDDGDKQTWAVKFIGAHQKTPDVRTIYTVTGDAYTAPVTDPKLYSLSLLGWSPDGRYLLIHQDDISNLLDMRFLLGDVGASPFQVRTLPLPEMPPGVGFTFPVANWSPSRQRVLITRRNLRDDAGRVTAAEVYDPMHDVAHSLTIANGLNVHGWLDEDHLLLLRYGSTSGEKVTYFSHDLATDKDTQIERPMALLSARRRQAFVSPKAPDLTLETQPQTMKDAQGVAETKARSVWIRRALAPKPVSALAVGVTPGEDDSQAAWSPDGDAIAYVTHGDLFVTNLVKADATASEKLAAGETLDCTEERQIVEANLKQIGLGIVQYCQDNDEKYPSADGFRDKVVVFLKDESLFSLGNSRFAYHPPADLSVASMDDPASTVLGTQGTPCAHIVLYADGHVKSYDKEGNLITEPKQ